MENNVIENKSPFAIARDEYRKEIYKTGKSLVGTLRDNFKEIEEIIADGKAKKKSEQTKTAYSVIKDVLVSLGTISSVDEISDNALGSYISQIRKEKAKIKSLNHGIAVQEGKEKAKETKSKSSKPSSTTSDSKVVNSASQNTTAEVSTLDRQPKQPPPIQTVALLTEEQLTSHDLDWDEPTWYYDIAEEEFFLANFNIFYNKNKGGKGVEPLKDEQGNYIWSDYWENLYRFIIKEARRLGIPDYKIRIPTGHFDNKVSYIWDKLTKVRSALGMNIDGKMYP